MESSELKEGDFVRVENHDYEFRGTVQSIWRKRSGALRVVVESDDGVCLIQSLKNLVIVHKGGRPFEQSPPPDLSAMQVPEPGQGRKYKGEPL